MVGNRLARPMVAMLVAVALISACGSSSPTTATTTTKATDTPTGSGDATAFGSADCQFLVKAMVANPLATSGSKDIDWEAFAKTFEDLAKKAPDELKGDFQAIADLYVEIGPDLSAFVKAQASGKQPTAEQLAKLQAFGSKFSAPRISQALSNLSTYISSKCSGAATN